MSDEKLFKFCFGAEPSVFSKRVILTPFLPLKRFESYCDVDAVFKGRLYSGFTAAIKGRKITIVYTGIGSGLAGDAVLLLRCTKAEELVFAGTCGGLNDCRIGDFIVSESAFNGEGFSKYHEKGFSIEKLFGTERIISAHPAYTKKLMRFLEERSMRYAVRSMALKKGSIFTTGSLLAEERKNISFIQDKGFKGIEMELSAVYRAAEIAGIKAAGLLVVSDMPLTKGIWGELESFERKAFAKGIKDLVRFSLEFAGGTI